MFFEMTEGGRMWLFDGLAFTCARGGDVGRFSADLPISARLGDQQPLPSRRASMQDAPSFRAWAGYISFLGVPPPDFRLDTHIHRQRIFDYSGYTSPRTANSRSSHTRER